MTDTSATPHPYSAPVATLLTFGDVRGQKDWPDYLALGFTEADVPELCRMVLDEDLYWADSDSDEVWAALHAWRTLAQLKADSALPTLMKLLYQYDAYEDDWVSTELPQVFGHIGAAALAPLTDFMADMNEGMWARLIAADGIAKIGEYDAALRDDCVTAISQQLGLFAQQDQSFNGHLISSLIDLKAVEASSVIEQAYAADRVDLMVQGDWEDAQIHLGLLTERQSPPPDYRQIMTDQMGFDPDELLQGLKKRVAVQAQQKAIRQAEAKTRKKVKNKRKTAKKMRKKQRKRK